MTSYNERLSVIEKRLSNIENLVSLKNINITNEEASPTNEIAPILVTAGKLVLKNLPLVFNAIETIKDALDNGVNDNTDIVSKLDQFINLGKEISDVLEKVK